MCTNGYQGIISDIITFLAITFGVMVVINNNPVVSVLFLIGLFGCISILLILYGLTFLGLAYLVVYIGAITILFLFILMLIDIRNSELKSYTRNTIALVVITVICIYLVPFNSSPYVFANESHDYYSMYDWFFKMVNFLRDELHNLPRETMYVVIAARLYPKYIDDFYKISGIMWDGNLAESELMASIGSVMYTSFNMFLLMSGFILLLSMVGVLVIVFNPYTNTSSKEVHVPNIFKKLRGININIYQFVSSSPFILFNMCQTKGIRSFSSSSNLSAKKGSADLNKQQSSAPEAGVKSSSSAFSLFKINLFKYFTMRNILVGLLTLTIVLIFRHYILTFILSCLNIKLPPFSFDFIVGFFGLIIRLLLGSGLSAVMTEDGTVVGGGGIMDTILRKYGSDSGSGNPGNNSGGGSGSASGSGNPGNNSGGGSGLASSDPRNITSQTSDETRGRRRGGNNHLDVNNTPNKGERSKSMVDKVKGLWSRSRSRAGEIWAGAKRGTSSNPAAANVPATPAADSSSNDGRPSTPINRMFITNADPSMPPLSYSPEEDASKRVANFNKQHAKAKEGWFDQIAEFDKRRNSYQDSTTELDSKANENKKEDSGNGDGNGKGGKGKRGKGK